MIQRTTDDYYFATDIDENLITVSANMVNDFEDSSKTSRQFKTFCTCIEKLSWFQTYPEPSGLKSLHEQRSHSSVQPKTSISRKRFRSAAIVMADGAFAGFAPFR